MLSPARVPGPLGMQDEVTAEESSSSDEEKPASAKGSALKAAAGIAQQVAKNLMSRKGGQPSKENKGTTQAAKEASDKDTWERWDKYIKGLNLSTNKDEGVL